MEAIKPPLVVFNYIPPTNILLFLEPLFSILGNKKRATLLLPFNPRRISIENHLFAVFHPYNTLKYRFWIFL